MVRIVVDQRLAELGLDEKEQRFYLAALQMGSATVTDIATRAGISRTNGYDLLQRLERRGLLSQVQGNGARRIVAEDPKVLFDSWERTRGMLDSLVPELKSVFNGGLRKPRVRYYEGDAGIRRTLWATLECHQGPLCGILSMHELLEVPGQKEMKKFISERVRRNLPLKVLRSHSRETEAIWPTSVAEDRELRYVPSAFDFGTTMFIHDNTVSYISSKRESYGLVIESEEHAQLHRSMFEALWVVSEPSPVKN
jgi:sugar-specific transcriptional regulator TrmB